MNNKPTVFCLMGPTASGKTALSLALAQQYPFEIINVDSAQIYQGMDIGSGKISQTIRSQIPHHLIDFLDPSLPYSVGKFCDDAKAIMDNIIARDRIPLLVGGTMLYFKALQEGLSPLPASNPAIRQKLEKFAQDRGFSFLHEQLKELDPKTAARIQPTDPQRILRALEIIELTGHTMSFWHEKTLEESPFQFVNMALIPVFSPRQQLHDRIANRFDEMLAEGLVEEVQQLLQRHDLDLNLPSMRAVGYRQVIQYLLGNISFEYMREQAIAATRQFAKRQLTWLRHWSQPVHFLDFLTPDLLPQSQQIIENSL